MSADEGRAGPVVRRSDEVIWDRVDGAMLLCHTGTVDFFRLNDTGAAIWDLCDGLTVDEIVAMMRERYPGADREQIATMVRDYLPALVGEGLVVFSDATHALIPDRHDPPS